MVSRTEPYSKPSKVKFTPDVVIVVVLYNEEYGKTSYANIKNVVADAERMRQSFKALRIPDKNITFLKDGTWD